MLIALVLIKKNPHITLGSQNKSQVDRIDGAKAADLTKKVKLLCSGQGGVPLPAEDKKPAQVTTWYIL